MEEEDSSRKEFDYSGKLLEKSIESVCIILKNSLIDFILKKLEN